MEVLFQDEGFHQYMIFDSVDADIEQYEVHMLMQFHGTSLLPLKLYGQNGTMRIQYDISGTASLEQMIRGHELKEAFLKRLFQTLWKCQEELEEYLLPVEGIRLEPAMIYYQPGKEQIRFCYQLGRREAFGEAFLNLVEFCMKHTDHEDAQGVMFIYGLYRYVQKDQLSLEEIREYIQREELVVVKRHNENKSTENTNRENPYSENPYSGNPYSGNPYSGHPYSENEYSGNQYSENKRKVPCDNKEPQKYFHNKEQKRDASGMGRYLYGSGFVLSICIMILFGIRFFAMTGLERDLKIFIIMTLISIFFLYSMLRSGKQSVKGLPEKIEQGDTPVDDAQQQEKPIVSMVEAPRIYIATHVEETQVLTSETDDSQSDIPIDMRMDASSTSVLTFWELESKSPSSANIQLNILPGVLGRKAEEVDYVISGDGISRRHAMIYISGDQLYVEDLASTNGTYVDHMRLKPEEPAVLKENSFLEIGPNQYQVKKKTVQKAG